jgi:hypothetical protein
VTRAQALVGRSPGAIFTAVRTLPQRPPESRRPSRGRYRICKAALKPPEEADILLVRSIEWMVVETDTYDTAVTALEQTNVILRHLFGAYLLSLLLQCLTALIFVLACGSGTFAPQHVPTRTGSHQYTRRAHGRISPVLYYLGNARARDGVPGTQGSPDEPKYAWSMPLQWRCFRRWSLRWYGHQVGRSERIDGILPRGLLKLTLELAVGIDGDMGKGTYTGEIYGEMLSLVACG